MVKRKVFNIKRIEKAGKITKDNNVDAYQGNFELDDSLNVDTAEEVSLETLNDGTRRISSIKVDDNPEITPGRKFARSFGLIAASCGLTYAYFKVGHLLWNNKNFGFFLIEFLFASGAAITGCSGLYNIFNIHSDGVIVSLIKAKRKNNNQVKVKKPRQLTLKKAKNDEYY